MLITIGNSAIPRTVASTASSLISSATLAAMHNMVKQSRLVIASLLTISSHHCCNKVHAVFNNKTGLGAKTLESGKSHLDTVAVLHILPRLYYEQSVVL
jgi:hypothetical protein